jgi:hypothetical protein
MQSSCSRQNQSRFFLSVAPTIHTSRWQEPEKKHRKSILNHSGFFFLLLLVLLNDPGSPTWLFFLVFYILVTSCQLECGCCWGFVLLAMCLKCCWQRNKPRGFRCQHHEQVFCQKPLGFVPLSTSANIMTSSLLGASENVRKTWDVGVSINGLNFHFRRTWWRVC